MSTEGTAVLAAAALALGWMAYVLFWKYRGGRDTPLPKPQEHKHVDN